MRPAPLPHSRGNPDFLTLKGLRDSWSQAASSEKAKQPDQGMEKMKWDLFEGPPMDFII